MMYDHSNPNKNVTTCVLYIYNYIIYVHHFSRSLPHPIFLGLATVYISCAPLIRGPNAALTLEEKKKVFVAAVPLIRGCASGWSFQRY